MVKQHEALARLPGKSFLDLPDHVRQQIYHDAEIYFYWLVLGHVLFSCGSRQMVYNLMQTCKEVYADIQAYIFLKHDVVVPSSNIENGLLLLTRLTPQICSDLQDLSVHLYIPDPVNNWEAGQNQLEHYVPPVPLTSDLIKLWQTAAAHILTLSKPNTLVLRLICDSGDSEETLAVLQPFFDFPGILKDCQIRLSSTRIRHVSILAAKAVASATGRYVPSLQTQPFPYLRLPTEIRRHVLEYTDLVTPRREIYWSHGGGFCIWRARCRCDRDEPLLEGREKHYPCQFERCSGTEKGYAGQAACHQTDSGFAFGCHCWMPPTYLLLVSRLFYAEAIATLYAENNFTVTPSGELIEDRGLGSDALQNRLHESEFLTKNLAVDSLYHLRSLELTFPPFKREFYEASSSEHGIRDWNSALSHLVNHANLSNLTMVLSMALGTREFEIGEEGSWGLDDNYFLRRVREGGENGDSVLQIHKFLLEPLRKGRQLNRLFIFLEYPWHWSGSFEKLESLNSRPDWWPRPYPNRQVLEMERRLESWVMGSEYDSHSLGKKEWRANNWLYSFWVKEYHR